MPSLRFANLYQCQRGSVRDISHEVLESAADATDSKCSSAACNTGKLSKFCMKNDLCSMHNLPSPHGHEWIVETDENGYDIYVC